MRKRSNSGGAQVFRITGARQGLADDVRARQRRYIISMSVRTVAVVLAAVLWNVERHVAFVALVLGMVLPYISVVIANAGRENAPATPVDVRDGSGAADDHAAAAGRGLRGIRDGGRRGRSGGRRAG